MQSLPFSVCFLFFVRCNPFCVSTNAHRTRIRIDSPLQSSSVMTFDRMGEREYSLAATLVLDAVASVFTCSGAVDAGPWESLEDLTEDLQARQLIKRSYWDHHQEQKPDTETQQATTTAGAEGDGASGTGASASDSAFEGYEDTDAVLLAAVEEAEAQAKVAEASDGEVR